LDFSILLSGQQAHKKTPLRAVLVRIIEALLIVSQACKNRVEKPLSKSSKSKKHSPRNVYFVIAGILIKLKGNRNYGNGGYGYDNCNSKIWKCCFAAW